MWIFWTAALAGVGWFFYQASQDVEVVCSCPNGAICAEPLLNEIGTILGLNNLTPKQIAQFAQNAGFSGADLAVAVAVALAESGGNPRAYNPVTNLDSGKPASTPAGQGAIGLWQIYLKVHPEFSGQNLYDPQTNANAAFQIYSASGSSFHPWSTYGNGSGIYSGYMAQANLAVDSLSDPTPDALALQCAGVVCPTSGQSS